MAQTKKQKRFNYNSLIMAFAKHSIEELDKIMCEAVNVSHDQYLKMNFMDQSKVRTKYMEQVHGKKKGKEK